MPAQWAENCQKLARRLGPLPYRQLSSQEIQTVYTRSYVEGMLQRAIRNRAYDRAREPAPRDEDDERANIEYVIALWREGGM